MVSTLTWFCCCHCKACCLSAAAAADSSRASSQLQVLEMSLLGAFSEDSLVLPSQKPKLEDRCVGHPENKPFALLWCAGAVGLAACVFLQPGHASSAGRFSTVVTPCILAFLPSLSNTCWRDCMKSVGFPHQALAPAACTEMSCSCILRHVSAGLLLHTVVWVFTAFTKWLWK